MTRDEAKALAEELAEECMVKLVDHAEDDHDSTRHIQQAIEKALSRALTPTRIEAAERALIEIAMEWRRLDAQRYALRTQGEQQRLYDLIRLEIEAIDRLRALREQRAAEECGEASPWRVALPGIKASGSTGARCHLPRGHEGEHEGELGTWGWS